MLELFRSPRRAIVWFVEASLLSSIAISALGVSLGFHRAFDGVHLLSSILVCAVTQTSMYYHGLYRSRPLGRFELVRGMGQALLVSAAVIWAVSLLFAPDDHALTRAFFATLGAAAIVLPTWRAAWQRIERSDVFRKPTIILGTGPLGRACASLINTETTGLALAGMITQRGATDALEPGVLGGPDDVARLVEERGITHVIVAFEERRGALPMEALLELEVRGVVVEHGQAFFERVSGRVFVPALRPSDLLFIDLHPSPLTRCTKRALDLVTSSIGLVLAAPLLALAAIAIKLDSPGPVLYAQERTGERGRLFSVRKLRSMRTDAEARGASWAAESDPRVTRVGRFLRRTRIDEIPQLWNVLVGEMSLVGPRPERPIFTAEIERHVPLFRQRLRVKPGVTGHAQVRCRYGASIDDAREKLSYDLFYIKSLSVWFDLSILVDTVKVVLLGIGSR